MRTKPVMTRIRARVVFYDSQTGAIIEESDNAIFWGKKPYMDKGYAKIFVAFLRDILENRRLGTGAWRLLMYMTERLNYDTLTVAIEPNEAIRTLGICRASFYNWLKVLLEEDFIEKLATNIYRLKPYTVIKGQMHKIALPQRRFEP
jgi:hypothetical protein